MSFLVSPVSTLPLWHAALVLAPALVLGLAAALVGRGRALPLSVAVSVNAAWRTARGAATAGVALALAALVLVALGQQGAGFGQRADPLGATVMLLVAFVGWVIVRYSQRYLQGERQELHYVRWLLATLATVFLVVATNNVLVLALAWMGTSLALHHLLVFFKERPAAVMAAHKKFIVARLADLCMAGAVLLLYLAFGTLSMDAMFRVATALPQWPMSAHAAVLLLALAALLKCAQLPFHGWLIQVMEAPTPVSALLHAGIVNLGGFVLIRFAPLVSQVPSAQVLLVVVGTTTAVLASLVMTTRISVKVMLAWSTCAQMGFMLMQCGLGAWEMALLHLLAHSLYKAHAFLSAGGVVQRSMVAQMTAVQQPGSWGTTLLGMVAGTGMVLAAGGAWSALLPAAVASPALWVLAGIVALALVPLVNGRALALGGWRLPALAAGAFAVAFAYFGLHVLFSAWLRVPMQAPITALWVLVALAFVGLFALQTQIVVAPRSPVIQTLYPWFYGGLFLDEKFNGIAFRLWPPGQPTAPPVVHAIPVPVSSTRNLPIVSGVSA